MIPIRHRSGTQSASYPRGIGEKLPEREADHSPPPGAEIKNVCRGT
jgi:hypothetical protein